MADDIKPKVKVTETDLSAIIPLGEPLDTAFKGGIKKGELILIGVGKYSGQPVRPQDGVNIIITDLNWRPGSTIQSESRLNRKPPPKPKIIRNGRYYTMATLDCTDLPRCFKFKNRRTAMKFFSKGPLIMKSSKQFSSVFGKPQRMKVHYENPLKTQVNIELTLAAGANPTYLDLEGRPSFAESTTMQHLKILKDKGVPIPLSQSMDADFEIADHFGTQFINVVPKDQT